MHKRKTGSAGVDDYHRSQRHNHVHLWHLIQSIPAFFLGASEFDGMASLIALENNSDLMP